MIFNWYKIINQAEFLATGLPSREVSVILQGVGSATILVTVGRLVSIVYNGVFLSIGMTDAVPFVFGGYAVALDPAGNICLGIPTT